MKNFVKKTLFLFSEIPSSLPMNRQYFRWMLECVPYRLCVSKYSLFALFSTLLGESQLASQVLCLPDRRFSKLFYDLLLIMRYYYGQKSSKQLILLLFLITFFLQGTRHFCRRVPSGSLAPSCDFFSPLSN